MTQLTPHVEFSTFTICLPPLRTCPVCSVHHCVPVDDPRWMLNKYVREGSRRYWNTRLSFLSFWGEEMEYIYSRQKLVSLFLMKGRKEVLTRERKDQPPACSWESSRTYLRGRKDSIKTVCVSAIWLSVVVRVRVLCVGDGEWVALSLWFEEF